MTSAARVTGVIDPLGKAVDTTHAGGYLLDPHLLQLGSLVQEDHIIFSSLVLIQVFIVVAIAEFNSAAIGEGKHLLRLVVLGDAVQLVYQLIDMVVHQLREGPAHDQNLNALIAHCQDLRLCTDTPALTTTTSATESNMLLIRGQKSILFIADLT